MNKIQKIIKDIKEVSCNLIQNSFKFSRYELTSKLVDVPIKVKVPPKIAAYDNGRRILVGLT